MKTRMRISLALITVAISSFAILSCSKTNDETQNTKSKQETTTTQKNLKQLLSRLPKMIMINGKSVDLSKGGFDFSQPNDGFNYSSSVGVQYSEANHTLYLEPGSFGSGVGGTVVAGSTAMDINYTFCFSAANNEQGFDLMDLGTTGVSSVIGISGNFDALTNSSADSADFADIIKGIAIYVVYDNEAQGSYEIVNWFENMGQPAAQLDKKGFAYVIDFVHGKIFLSKSGNLSVNGGSIGFTGRYLEIANFVLGEDMDENNIQYNEVDGFGTMGCN